MGIHHTARDRQTELRRRMFGVAALVPVRIAVDRLSLSFAPGYAPCRVTSSDAYWHDATNTLRVHRSPFQRLHAPDELTDGEARAWTEFRPEMVDYARLTESMQWVLLVVIFGMAIFGVANTLLVVAGSLADAAVQWGVQTWDWLPRIGQGLDASPTTEE